MLNNLGVKALEDPFNRLTGIKGVHGVIPQRHDCVALSIFPYDFSLVVNNGEAPFRAFDFFFAVPYDFRIYADGELAVEIGNKKPVPEAGLVGRKAYAPGFDHEFPHELNGINIRALFTDFSRCP